MRMKLGCAIVCGGIVGSNVGITLRGALVSRPERVIQMGADNDSMELSFRVRARSLLPD